MIASTVKALITSLYKYEDDYIPHATQDMLELNFLIDFMLREDVQSVLTFGVDHGGVEYRIAEAYSKANKKCFITGLDWCIRDTLIQSYAKILAVFPTITMNFVKADLSRPFPFFLLGNYDFTFIDADHAYISVKKNFQLALNHTTRFIGFHDISYDDPDTHDGPTGGVKRLWEEIKDDYYDYIECIHTYGIGIIGMKESCHTGMPLIIKEKLTV